MTRGRRVASAPIASARRSGTSRSSTATSSTTRSSWKSTPDSLQAQARLLDLRLLLGVRLRGLADEELAVDVAADVDEEVLAHVALVLELEVPAALDRLFLGDLGGVEVRGVGLR